MLLHDNDNSYVKLDHLMVRMIVFPLSCRIFLHLHGNDTVTSAQKEKYLYGHFSPDPNELAMCLMDV